MRKLLLLALLLYNVVALATRSNYDYDDVDGSKRHALIDERRNWRKKALGKPLEPLKEWDRRRHDYDSPPRFMEEPEQKRTDFSRNLDRQRELDLSSGYREMGTRHFDDAEKLNIPPAVKSVEIHSSTFMDKEGDKKNLAASINCDRQHERYEACFAGCASVTCDNPRDRLRPCYPFCEPGCICMHPYVRDDRTHKCVLPEECTKGLKGIPDIGEDI